MPQKLSDHQLKYFTGYEDGSDLAAKTSASDQPSPSLNLQVGGAGRRVRLKGPQMVVHCPAVDVQPPKSHRLSSAVQQFFLGATEQVHGGPLKIIKKI